MSEFENNSITDEDILNAQINSPEKIRYFINRTKKIVPAGLRKHWEEDCYRLIAVYNENAYSIILYAAKIMIIAKNYSSTEELTSLIDSLMFDIPDDMNYDELKFLLSKYTPDYYQVLNIFLFDLTDVSNKVKTYMKTNKKESL